MVAEDLYKREPIPQNGLFSDPHTYLSRSFIRAMEPIYRSRIGRRRLHDIIDLLIQEDVISKALYNLSYYFTLLETSELFNYVKNDSSKINLTNLVSSLNIDILPPESFINKTNRSSYIEGDYLLTPNICSSINKFNFGKYGDRLVNLNLLAVAKPEVRIFIDKLILFSSRWDITNRVVVRSASEEHEELFNAVDDLVGALFNLKNTEIFQFTKTFTEDTVVTLFDKERNFLCGVYYSSIVDSLTRHIVKDSPKK